MVSYAEPVVVNNGESCCASGCESCCAMFSPWLWIMANNAVPVDMNHDVNAVPVGVNHAVLYWASRWEWRCERCASRCESWWVMLLSQWLWITMCYAEPIVVKHCEWYLDIGCESLWGMLSQWLWIIMFYAEPVCWNHGVLCRASDSESLCVMLSRVCGNHGVLCWASGWESRCEFCASGCESLCVFLCQ
jgi:hypothetical protein